MIISGIDGMKCINHNNLEIGYFLGYLSFNYMNMSALFSKKKNTQKTSSKMIFDACDFCRNISL